MTRYEELEEKFKTKEYVHSYKGFSPFYIGIFYGSSSVLGGEKKYSHCAGFFPGVCDVDYWITSELEKLSDEEHQELFNILIRNSNLYSYTAIRVPEIAGYIGVETKHVYRLGRRKILDLLLMIDRMKEDNATIKYCATAINGAPLEALDLIENCELHKEVQDYIKFAAFKKYQQEQNAIEVVPSDIDYEELAAELLSIELGIAIPGDIDE